ncbi:hypothetical protein ASPWEDRAFT_49469 [Aspergillus wentii DTO 134E9]|uniref:Maintenance of telomere capping protein 1 n=1 Tax=Aspergillus wentii DTO 134E9 TaxID=1073089 RepID=A0A1L9RXC3_ASPWE|nr:uncharacterized protein ASPWEDRAFT_49469 [Aspergillus wentii DTO 134E9]KAI9931827.1 hypothetical protein MW887_010411 [Aspergillus wentii]OJJ39488.1 hypothetical protein ASPWEDRAFT_49469 [Aspergillus wentii DTO 134E9]
MPPKSSKPTSDELLAQFDDLGIDSSDKQQQQQQQPASTSANAATGQSEQDILAELDNLASQRPSSGPGTPRLSTNEPRPSIKSPKPAANATPSAGRSSEEKPARKSAESGRSSRAGNKAGNNVQQSDSEKAAAEEAAQGGGGGWWGGFFATASAAMKQAEAAVKEIQNNEEAQKWAQQVKGNVGTLKDIGGGLRDMAIPTFTSLIHTLAPPISSHERLQIHVTHDLSGYPAVDPLVYSVFSRVMAQVEGGDLLVLQRGQESAPKRGLDIGGFQSSGAGWHDGPWWRTVTPGNPRSISAVPGTVAATKLARASAESYAAEYFSSRGGVEEAAKQASEVLSESNPVRSSDIFLAIQAISNESSTELFQAGPTTEKATPQGVVDVPDAKEGEVSFALYLHDPIHGIAFHTISQAIPQKWVEWLDASVPAPEDPHAEDAQVPRVVIPDSIAEIIESGGVDPREWVAEWIEDSICLAIGIVAQRYVARRMGVGEGGVGKGKMRAETSSVEKGAGEIARAL